MSGARWARERTGADFHPDTDTRAQTSIWNVNIARLTDFRGRAAMTLPVRGSRPLGGRFRANERMGTK